MMVEGFAGSVFIMMDGAHCASCHRWGRMRLLIRRTGSHLWLVFWDFVWGACCCHEGLGRSLWVEVERDVCALTPSPSTISVGVWYLCAGYRLGNMFNLRSQYYVFWPFNNYRVLMKSRVGWIIRYEYIRQILRIKSQRYTATVTV